jgi:hypothetical protein
VELGEAFLACALDQELGQGVVFREELRNLFGATWFRAHRGQYVYRGWYLLIRARSAYEIHETVEWFELVEGQRCPESH